MSRRNRQSSQNQEDQVQEGVVEGAEEETGEGKVYTYVGAGEDPPRKINFMGVQEFVRGKAVQVTDKALLKKLEKHPCFVEGEVEMEDLHDQDEKAAKEADAQRLQDKKTNAAFHAKHKTE